MPHPLVPRIGVGSVSSPLEVGADRAPQAAETLASVLALAGCEVIRLGPIGNTQAAAAAGRRLAEEHADAVALAPVSWFEDYLVVDLIEEACLPVLFRPLPGMETGALCGTQQATCYLKYLGHPFESGFGGLDDPALAERALSFLRAAALRQRLRRARIGVAGSRINGMTHPAADEFRLKAVVGPRLVFLDLPRLLARAREVPDGEARARWGAMVAQAGACRVSEADGLDSMRIYLAVREQVAQHGLSALTIGCYPHLMGRVCLAASLLADEGVALACEGDVHGAVAQYLLWLLTGQPTHNTDWLEPLPDGSVVFTHCGSGSLSLAERRADILLGSVRLMGQGVCALFPARPGPVTLVGFVPRPDGYQCALLEGEAVSTDMVFPGNPVRVRFQAATGDLIDWIHREGIGHHWMIGYGHVASEVQHWARIVGAGLRLVSA